MLNTEIAVQKDLNGLIDKLKVAQDNYRHVLLLLEANQRTLGEDSWISESKDTIIPLNDVLRQYVEKIIELYDQLINECKKLGDNADAFVGHSRNVGKLW